MKNFNRRHFLELAAIGGAFLYTAPAGISAAAAQADAGVRQLRGDAFLVEGFGTNVLGLQGADGLMLVDGVAAEYTEPFLAALRDHTGNVPVDLLYNTHWHWEHTGSNEAFGEQGTRIVAHENTRLWLGAEFYVDWQDRTYQPRPSQALPTDTFYEDHQEHFGDETVDSKLLFQAHTDGDIYVYLREHNILMAGDLVGDGVFPLIDPATGGWIGGLVDAQAHLLELADDDTLIVPGSGAVQSRAQLEVQHTHLVEMRDRLFDRVKEGKGPRELLEAGVTEGLEDWGDLTQFVLNAYPGLWQHRRNLDGVI